MVSKRIKAIKQADKSEFSWLTVNEYLSDELALDSDDGKNMYRAERRAERNGRTSVGTNRSSSTFTASNAFTPQPEFSASDKPSHRVFNSSRRLRPLFKISIYSFLFHIAYLLCFFFLGIYGVTHRPYPILSMIWCILLFSNFHYP